jgi:hypothetical protein
VDETQRKLLHRQAAKIQIDLTPGQRVAALLALDQADRDWLTLLPPREQEVVLEVVTRLGGVIE